MVANATVGVLQESSAEAAVEALKEYESPSAAVYRGGHLINIPAAQLVVGDIIEVEAGDLVPADARMLIRISSSFDVAQELLTGMYPTRALSLSLSLSRSLTSVHIEFVTR